MKKILILLPMLIIVLSSCSNYSYKNLLSVRQDMTIDEVVEVINSFWKPNFDVFMINDQRSDTFDISKKIKAKVKTTILIAKKKAIAKNKSLKDDKYHVFASENDPYYVFAFENDKLIYWGLPIDFKRSSNAKFVKIGTEAVRIIHRDYLDD